jgi:hypothetical protein
MIFRHLQNSSIEIFRHGDTTTFSIIKQVLKSEILPIKTDRRSICKKLSSAPFITIHFTIQNNKQMEQTQSKSDNLAPFKNIIDAFESKTPEIIMDAMATMVFEMMLRSDEVGKETKKQIDRAYLVYSTMRDARQI